MPPNAIERHIIVGAKRVAGRTLNCAKRQGVYGGEVAGVGFPLSKKVLVNPHAAIIGQEHGFGTVKNFVDLVTTVAKGSNKSGILVCQGKPGGGAYDFAIDRCQNGDAGGGI